MIRRLTKLCIIFVAGMLLWGMMGNETVYAGSKGIKISKKNFPDTAFRNHVKKKYDKNKNGHLSMTERRRVTEIVHQPYDNELFPRPMKGWLRYHSLKGIEYFPELKRVEITNVNVGNPDFRKNKKLETIHFSATNTTKINVRNNKKLKVLHVQPTFDTKWREKHPLREVNLSNNTELEEVSLGDGLKKLDVTKLTKLKRLTVSGNLQVLNLSNNLQLEKLVCTGNQLQELDLTNCPKLGVLLCDDNHLTRLQLSANITLSWFDCTKNNLTRLAFNHVTFTGLCLYDKNVVLDYGS